MSDTIFVLTLRNPFLFMADDNPIVEEYRGVPIRRYPRVYLRISIYEMKRFIDAEKDFDLSAKEAIKSKKIWCTECNDTSIKRFNK